MSTRNLVLCYTICLDDDWYGDNHRFILEDGFTTKAAAKKHLADFKRFLAERCQYYVKSKLTTKDFKCVEADTLVDYTYISSGPSLSYTHHTFSINEIK